MLHLYHRERTFKPVKKSSTRLAKLLLYALSISLYTNQLHAAAAFPPDTNVQYIPVKYSQLNGWKTAEQLHSYYALENSCKSIINSSNYDNTWLNACKAVLNANINTNQQARALFERYFTPYLIKDNNTTKGLFTGYFEPFLQGSLTPSKVYNIPLYKTPEELVRKKINGKIRYGYMVKGKLTPFYTREEIANNPNLIPKEDVLLWVKSRIDRTFLQIQGSGRIILPDGKKLLVGYAGQNGQPYRPIGRYLLQNKLVPRDQITMQSIRAWLENHPTQRDKVLNFDPSFVFFKFVDQENPVGSQGIPLTPGYSLAIDPKYYQYGTPIWLDTTYQTPDKKENKLNRLLIAQDSGGAIKGPIRGDVFWGNGKLAEYYAGHMKHKGSMYILLPKAIDK